MATRRYSLHAFSGLLIVIFLIAVLALGSCSEDSPVAEKSGNGGQEDPPPPPLPDSAIVTVRLVSWDDLSGHGAGIDAPGDVDEVRFEISASDIQTQTRSVQVSQAIVEEDFIVKTGAARRIEVQAFNAADSLLYGGTKYTDFLDSVLVTAVGMVSAADVTPPVYAGLEETFVVSDNHVLISWQIATDGSEPDYEAIYLIYVSTVSGSFDYSSPSYTSAPGETSYLIADLDPATTYYFVVRAMDRAGNVETNTSQLSLTTPPAGGALYVDVNTGSDGPTCGTSSSPCKTITYALNKTAGNQTIHVAKGTYNAASGETFPLQLKSGTTLSGEGYWWMGIKVIKETFIEGTTPVILGADDATVVSCYIKPTAWGASGRTIDDDGHPMTVFHCTIDGTQLPGGYGVVFIAGSSLIGTEIRNFGNGGRAVGVSGTGGVLIKGNGIRNNTHGITVNASNCEISHCVVEDITAIGISLGFRDVETDNVLIFRNHMENTGDNGIRITHCTDTEIIFNSISHAGNFGLQIWNYERPTYTVKAILNSISNGDRAGIYVLDGQASINDNSIVCNVGGVMVRSDQVIDLRWNSWDHYPPTVSDGRASDEWCDGPYDICYEAVYSGTPEPVYHPASPKGTCIIGIMPAPPR